MFTPISGLNVVHGSTRQLDLDFTLDWEEIENKKDVRYVF